MKPTGATGFEPILQESKSCVLTVYTIPQNLLLAIPNIYSPKTPLNFPSFPFRLASSVDRVYFLFPFSLRLIFFANMSFIHIVRRVITLAVNTNHVFKIVNGAPFAVFTCIHSFHYPPFLFFKIFQNKVVLCFGF